MRQSVFTAAMLMLATAVSAQSVPTSEADQIQALAAGAKRKGDETGLMLRDTQQGVGNFIGALGRKPGDIDTSKEGFSVRIYTPVAWLHQLSANAAKEYRTLTPETLPDSALQPVVRVKVYPDTPHSVVAGAVSGTSSVEHVVLTSKDKEQIVQPLSKEPFTEDVQNGFGAKLQYTGVIATFPLDAVRELRGGSGDQEFNIIVVGNGRKERQFTVKKKHFERLP